MSANSRNTGSDWVDPDDAPELDDDFFEEADEYRGDKLVRRGRPRSERPKEHITIRLDQDVLEAFRASGPGWQTRINKALKLFLEEHSASEAESR